MTNPTNEERWAVMMVQARRFAAREQLTDALARARLVRDEMLAARAEVTEPAGRGRLDRQIARVDAELQSLSARHAEWQERIAKIARARRDGAPEEMRRPLPDPEPDRPL
jgi:hypothetical protein